jgi:predicted transcriptional regulator
MLEQLFGSQTRVKLLHVFLNNPEKAYFVRELTRMLGSQINAVRRELENLETIGLIKVVIQEEDVKSSSKMKYFQAVPDFLFYTELKNLIRKNQFTLEQEFSTALQKIGDIRYLALTGKFVGLESVKTDLLLVGDIDKDKFKKLLTIYEKKFNKEINFTLMTVEEFSYRRNVADKFLYSILDNKKIVMIDSLINTGNYRF